MDANAVAVIAVVVSVGACAVACVAYRNARDALDFVNRVCAIMDSRSSRTVVVDHTDGRITIVKELKDAE